MDVASMPNLAGAPYQSRAMDKSDIRELRSWHRNAALRAKEAGFDVVYVYATHGYLLSHFLSAAPTPAVTSTAARWRIEHACCAN